MSLILAQGKGISLPNPAEKPAKQKTEQPAEKTAEKNKK